MREHVSYESLARRADAPRGSAWGLFGKHDELGSVNFLTPTNVLDGVALVLKGARFNLDYPLDEFNPPLFRNRSQIVHSISADGPSRREDRVDSFFPQGSSHVDGLSHRRDPRYGFYNGIDEGSVVAARRLGVDRWAAACIAGRSVLLDVDRYLRGRGQSLDHMSGEAFGVEVLESAAQVQGVRFQPGDILLIRTGWAGFYLGLPEEQRAAVRSSLHSPGLVQSDETLAWLWDHRFALVAADNVALEALPAIPGSPFRPEVSDGMMHHRLIAMLGLAIGELWFLDQLAMDCADDGVYEFFVTCHPLHLPGGVGSPANAMALK